VWEAQTGKICSSWRLSAVSPLISPAAQPEYSLASIPSRTSSQESQSGGGEGVLCCAFSVGGTSVVTASQNGAVRVSDMYWLVRYPVCVMTGYGKIGPL